MLLTYNANGKLVAMQDWNGTTSFALDVLGRATSVNDHNNRSESLGMVVLSLMRNNPVALQNWANPGSNVTKYHWVTITSAEINPFDFANSTVNYSTWGELHYGSKAYNWSSVWRSYDYERDSFLVKSSIVFIN